jgi:protein-arginine kinase activator protein McsA
LVKNKIRVRYLEEELNDMIDSENYEKAAQLRDEIKELKKIRYHKPCLIGGGKRRK